MVNTLEVSEEDNNETEYTIFYTSENVSTPIENKGCIMLFDETLGVDMDEMSYAYYAGLLGKATKHLPVKNQDDYDTENFIWTLNSDDYPIKFVNKEYSKDEILFTW